MTDGRTDRPTTARCRVACPRLRKHLFLVADSTPCRVGRSVGPSVKFLNREWFFAFPLLPNRPRLFCRVSGLVSFTIAFGFLEWRKNSMVEKKFYNRGEGGNSERERERSHTRKSPLWGQPEMPTERAKEKKCCRKKRAMKQTGFY